MAKHNLDEIFSLLSKGFSHSQVGEKIGVSRAVICGVVNRYGDIYGYKPRNNSLYYSHGAMVSHVIRRANKQARLKRWAEL